MTDTRDAVKILESLGITDLDGVSADVRQSIISVLKDAAERFLPFAELARYAEYGFAAEGEPERPVDTVIRTTRTALLDDDQPEGSMELLRTLSWSVQQLLTIIKR